MLLVLIAGAVIGLVTWLAVGTPFARRPVTRARIEHAVAQKPSGNVQLVLCNEEVVPSDSPQPKGAHTWTCDTYIGPNKADAQNGPSYQVVVSDDRIQSIRRVRTH